MDNQSLKQFFTHSLYGYDKQKVNVLKAILPILIIIHHIHGLGYKGVELFGASGDIVMYLFFAMSGFGLTISYLNSAQYVNGFLYRSLTKLYLPYLFTLIVFVIYRYFEGIDQIALLREKGLFWFVPTSWFIYVLSYLYIFFFFVFRYVKSSNAVKVLLTCLLVVGYVIVAHSIGVEPWRYNRCPAFCIGMMFALFDSSIRIKFVRWHALVALALLLLLLIVFYLSHARRLDILIFPTALFIFMYAVKGVRECKVVKFLSSISLEMFIIQFFPMYIVMNDLQITSTAIMVSLVLILDIAFAYIMHRIIKRINKCILKQGSTSHP